MTASYGARRASLTSAFRSETLKFKHSAPVRLAVALALPMPLLGAWPSMATGVQTFSAWNYWYTLFLPVALSLVTACVANADVRLKLRALLGQGAPLVHAWWAKALYCLALSLLANIIVFALYLLGSAFSSQGITLAGTLSMLACAFANALTTAWMIPAGLFLASRFGMLAGIFIPLVIQIAGEFAWSIIPLPQFFPPSATMVVPTFFIPVLPSGEPLSADMVLGGALAADLPFTLAGLAVCAAVFVVFTAAGAVWLKGAEER